MNTFYGMCDILWCRLLVSSLIVIFSLSGVIAAIGFLYTQGRSRSDAQRYRKLVPLYSQYLQAMARAEQRITDPVQQQQYCQNCILEAGKYALQEHADWYLIPRPLEFLPK